MEDYEKIRELLMKYSHKGVLKVESTGATLIGYAPHLGSEAWLNFIFATLNKQQIKELEISLGRQLPAAYADFLQNFSNGLFVLCNEFSLEGLRAHYRRVGGYELCQPYDLCYSNVYQRIKNATEEMLFIGSYSWDGSNLYMMNDGTVYYCARYDATPLKKWDSLTEMLLEEIPRLYSLYDEDGVKLDPKQSSLPI
ncbi:MAG: SMI1/KNR4 family protein [Muribaculaceae bacterium]|nr:SMI1/KNR4 family protein [Muribaculaceae bacterium]